MIPPIIGMRNTKRKANAIQTYTAMSVYRIVAWWRHSALKGWVNTGSGDSLLHDDTKPLPLPLTESISENHQYQWKFQKRHLIPQ